MYNCIAVVEGHTEVAFFKQIFSRKFLAMPCIPNGKDVSIDQIFSKICLNLDTVSQGITTVFVLFDREKRDISSAHIEANIKAKLEIRYPTLVFYIGVCDRMIENWILSGLENYIPDGRGADQSGKDHMRRLFSRDLSPNEKAIAMKKMNTALAMERSPSFKKFFEQVKCCCYWFPQHCEHCQT